MAALFMMTLQTKGQNMTLTSKQQALVAIAANEAKGNIEGLKAALNEGLETGLTVSEAKEALSQLYAYTGFPRSLNALGALQQVIKERTEAGLRVEEGREADPLPKDYDALKQGTEVQTQLCGGKPFTYTFAPQTDYYLKAHLFGDIFARNNLTFAECTWCIAAGHQGTHGGWTACGRRSRGRSATQGLRCAEARNRGANAALRRKAVHLHLRASDRLLSESTPLWRHLRPQQPNIC